MRRAKSGARSPESRMGSVREILEGAAKKLKKEAKATVGDFIRLLQIEREMQKEEEKKPKEIKVTWVDPPANTEE